MEMTDPFAVFRTALFIGLTVYYAVDMTLFTVRGLGLITGDDPRRRLVRAYLSYLLVTVRIGPLAGELRDIAVWTLVLLLLYGMHKWT